MDEEPTFSKLSEIQGEVERYVECTIGSKSHTEHDTRIAELQRIVDTVSHTPRVLAKRIIALENEKSKLSKENKALKEKMAIVTERLDAHMKKYHKKE